MKLKNKSILFFTITCLLLISGCDLFRKSADQYLQSGNMLLEQGKYVQASLQFRNAIQINQDMTLAWYGLSLAEESQGHMNKVYVLLNKVLELDPSHVEARIKRGKIFLLGKLLDKALVDSNKLMDSAPDDAAVRAFRAAVLLNLSDNEGAIAEANIALKKDPGNVDALIVLATERLTKGDMNAAITYLDKGIAINEKNLVLQLIKIKALDTLKNHEQVITVFKRLITLYPEAKAFRIALAQYYIANNKMDQAEKVYREAAESNVDDVDVKLDLVKFVFKERGTDEAVTQLKAYINEAPEQYQLQFALAELYQIAQRLVEAENVYKKIIDNNTGGPDALSAQIKLAAIAFKKSKLTTARKLISEVLEAEPTNSEGLILKATIELHQGNIDRAIVDLRTVIKNEPDSVKALVLLARSHLKNHSNELAKTSYQTAVQNEPTNQKVVLEYANFLVRSKELNSAEDVVQSLLDRVPNSLPGLQAMAQLKLRKGDWEGAHELAERIKVIGGKEAVAEQILGAVYRGQQQYQQSIDAFKRAHRASPSSVQPIVALVRSYVRVGKQEEASFFLKSVLEVHPSNIYALVLMGQRYMLDKDMEQAEIYFKRAAETNPEDALGYLELVRLYTKQQRYPEATDVIDRGLGKLPKNLSLNLAKARILEQEGRFEQAILLYEQILVKIPNIELAANNLASLLADYHPNNEKSLKRALEVSRGFESSNNPYFRDTIGWVYYRLGQADKAIPLLNDVVKAVPEMPVFHYHLGMSLLAAGKKNEAKSSLEKAVSLSDNNLTGMKDIKEVLNSL
jgi:tetratricopeptide (TPR) repeat protein